MTTISPQTDAPSGGPDSVRWYSPAKWWFLEGVALLFWLFLFLEAFVLDLGPRIERAFPAVGPMLPYRFLAALAVVAVFWLAAGTRRFLTTVTYVAVYPLLVVPWKIAKIIFRNWPVVFAFSPAIYSFATTPGTTFAFFVAALVSSVVVPHSDQHGYVVGGMCVLAAYLVTHYRRRFEMAFAPSTVFADIRTPLVKGWVALAAGSSAALRKADRDSEDYETERHDILAQLYMAMAVLHYASVRLQEVIESRKLDLYFVGSLFFTFALTTVVFSLEYLGLEKLAPGSFSGAASPTWLDFIGYSLSAIMNYAVSPLRPTSGFAQALTYLELFASLLILVLLVFVVLTVIRERFRSDLKDIVVATGAAAEHAASVITRDFDLSIEAAEARLLEHKPDAARWMFRVRYGEDDARRIPGYVVSEDEPEAS